MNRIETAVSAFKKGFSCSQAIFSSYGPGLGIDRKTALKAASAFGGGIGRTGATCGAVTGALMTIGLKHGRTRANDEQSRERTYALAQEFMKRFEEKNDTIICRDLLGVDISTPEGLKQVREDERFEELCAGLVRSAAEILETMV
jgi:C_GCAxxG_C_C family probable redox protein